MPKFRSKKFRLLVTVWKHAKFYDFPIKLANESLSKTALPKELCLFALSLSHVQLYDSPTNNGEILAKWFHLFMVLPNSQTFQ